jgi:hypothetical protein
MTVVVMRVAVVVAVVVVAACFHVVQLVCGDRPWSNHPQLHRGVSAAPRVSGTHLPS